MDDYCRVLIIDDEFIMRQGMKHMLEWEKEGFQIVGEASNGQEGLLLVEERKPHIVLTDIVMPVIDGIEFSDIMGKRYPDIQLIILSSYDKFEYVKATLLNGAADYVLKPTLNPEILLNTLHKAVDRIPGFQLNSRKEVPFAGQAEKFLLGFQEKLDEVTFSQCFPHTFFRLLALNVREAAGRRKEEMSSVQNMLVSYYKEKEDYVTLPVFFNEGILCVIINYRRKDEQAVITDAEDVSGRICRAYPRAFLVLSLNFTDKQEMRRHYRQEVTKEMARAFYYPERHLLITKGYQEDGAVRRFEFETYTRLLSQRHHGEALEMFEEYVRYLLKCQMEEERLKNLARNLLYNYLIELENHFSIDSDSLKEKYFAMLDEAVWLDRFEEALDQIISGLKLILEQNCSADDGRIIAMKQYVASHYQEPLDLSDIAEQFGLSYHYLSSYFSQTAKEGFNEYLNKLRIEHAMNLLRESDMSIAEIGCAAGYSEHSYFCRVFKKMTGDTPSGFRRREKLRER